MVFAAGGKNELVKKGNGMKIKIMPIVVTTVNDTRIRIVLDEDTSLWEGEVRRVDGEMTTIWKRVPPPEIETKDSVTTKYVNTWDYAERGN